MDVKSWRFWRGLLIGALLGFLYYRVVGCSSGHCMISSNPYISTAYGGMMGVLFFWSNTPTVNAQK